MGEFAAGMEGEDEADGNSYVGASLAAAGPL